MDLSRPKSKTDRSPLRRSPEEWEVARIMLLEPSCPPRNLLLRESQPPPNSLSSRNASRRQGITACRPACSHHNTKVTTTVGTCNVCTHPRGTKVYRFPRDLRRYRWDVVGLAEARWTGFEETQTLEGHKPFTTHVLAKAMLEGQTSTLVLIFNLQNNKKLFYIE